MSDFYVNHKVDHFEYYLPDNERRLAYTIDETITVAALSNGTIVSIGCNEHYKGKWNGLLHTGQTMKDVIKLTDRQRIFNGCIIVNDDFGFLFGLPAPYDEIADEVEHIPLDIVLNNIRVGDFSEWKPSK